MFNRNRDLLNEDLILLKSQTTLNKINRIIKRANILKVHACICSYLKEQMPTFGKDAKKKKLLENMAEVFEVVKTKNSLSSGDFPNPTRYAQLMSEVDFKTLHKLSGKTMKYGEL